MLLTYTAFLPVVKTNSGPTPQKGAKTTQQKSSKVTKPVPSRSTAGSKAKQQKGNTGVKATQQKNTSRTVQTSKPAPKPEKPLSEEEKLIQAAEKYHQQISGKKVQTADQQKSGSTAITPVAAGQQGPGTPVNTSKQIGVPKPVVSSKTSQPANQQKYVAPTNNIRKDDKQKEGKNSRATQQAVQQKAAVTTGISKTKVQQRAEMRNKANALMQMDDQEQGTGRDLSVNIYTGNPGIYHAEGDTLNFWSFTPVEIEAVSTAMAVEQPGKPYGFEGNKMPEAGQDWPFLLVLVGWSIFASLRFGFSKYIVQVFQSIFNYSVAARLYRERGYSSNFGVFRLNLIFFLFVPFPIYLIAKDNGVSLMGFSGIEFYLIVFAVVNAYFLLKLFLYKILGSVFSQRETTGELVFNMMLFNNVLGLVLLPVSTIHSMVPGFGIVSLFLVPGLIVLFYLMSIIRSIYFAIREGISIFYLILYLCALEILPILLVTKMAVSA